VTQRAGRAEEETSTDNAADGDCDEGEQRESVGALRTRPRRSGLALDGPGRGRRASKRSTHSSGHDGP